MSKKLGASKMANQLRFELKKLANPYPVMHNADLWGQLSVIILTDGQVVLLLRTQSNLDALAEWFAKSEYALAHDKLSDKFLLEGNQPTLEESLAVSLNKLQNRDFADDDEEAMFAWHDTLADYNRHHSLRVALEANVPNIIIGCNRGFGEISFTGDEDKESYPQLPDFYADLKEWSYSFDMDDFVTDLRKELKSFLLEWASPLQNEAPRLHAKELLEQLDKGVLGRV